MKKIFLTLIGLFIILSSIFSQKGLNISIEGSMLNTGITNQNTWSQHEFFEKPTLGNKFVLELGYNITNEWGVYTGFGIMTLGQNYKRDPETIDGSAILITSNSSWEREISLNYLMVPIMFKIIKPGNKVDFIGGGGVQFAFLYQADQLLMLNGSEYNTTVGVLTGGVVITDSIIYQIPGGQYTLSSWADKDVTNRFKTLDIILNLEAGARFPFREKLYLDLLFTVAHGFRDIDLETMKMYNEKSSHNIYAGIKLRFGLNSLWSTSEKTKP